MFSHENEGSGSGLHFIAVLTTTYILDYVYKIKCAGFFFSVTSLKCNSCSTYISFEDCIKQQQTTDCHKGYQCGKSHYKYNGTDIYNLSCISDLHCKDPADNMCGVNTYMSDCEVICCNEDLCNAAASSQVVSVSVILACGFSAYAWTMP